MKRRRPALKVEADYRILVDPYIPPLPPGPAARWRRWLMVTGLLLLLVAVGAGVWWTVQRTGKPAPAPDAPPAAAAASNETVEAAAEPEIPELPIGVVEVPGAGEEPEAPTCLGGIVVQVQAPVAARTYLQKTAKRLRLETNAWTSIPALPHILTNQPCGMAEVGFEATGFRSDPPSRRILVQEGRTNDASFTLHPLPATLTITCNVTNAVIALHPEPRTLNPDTFAVPSLQPVSVTVSATGYVAQTLALGPYNPLTTNRAAVKLEPEAKPEPPPAAAAPAGKAGESMTVDLGGGVKMEFVWIPPGKFMMGSPTSEAERYGDEGPQHQVTISKGFWMGKHEVTQEQWERVMGENPSHFVGNNNPVEKVSYMDSKLFLEKLCRLQGVSNGVYRLPSEAEWEYACRAGTESAFSFGQRLETSQANFDGSYPYANGVKGSYRRKTLPVGSFPPNAWGLHDMHGNVSEWCADIYNDYPKDSATDPSVTNAGGLAYVMRGGNWSSSAKSCRSACRDSGSFGTHGIITGLRVAREAP